MANGKVTRKEFHQALKILRSVVTSKEFKTSDIVYEYDGICKNVSVYIPGSSFDDVYDDIIDMVCKYSLGWKYRTTFKYNPVPIDDEYFDSSLWAGKQLFYRIALINYMLRLTR